MRALEAQLEAIRARLRSKPRVQRLTPGLPALTLGPPLPAGEIRAFESAYGVLLPEEYRAFVEKVGNGGLGPPNLGMVPLGAVARGAGAEALAGLRRPFPLTEYWVWEGEEPLSPEKIALRERVFTDGSLVLGEDGCGMFWHLVVTGPERGQMWHIADQGAQPCAPRRTFLSWYEYWLDGHDDWWADFEPAPG
jgi:hypothetical protein